jgi:HK97 family phage portal protein
MAYLDDLVKQAQQIATQAQMYAGQTMGYDGTQAYSSYFPLYEIQSPQYVSPSPYYLAQLGYRSNEVAYACMTVRSDAVSEAPVMVYQMDADGKPKAIDDHKMLDVIHNPCPRINETMFWWISELYCLIAGAAFWEKERDNLGRVIGLWPMRPDWCSRLRGEQQPVRAIRYQPYGLPYIDIPIENVVIFEYFDPLWPMLKGFSPTMALSEIIGLDKNITNIVNTFIKNGAFMGGVLSTEQFLDDIEAQRIRARWRQYHGGGENAGDIAVIGKGVTYSPTAQSFREMVFPELDARNEARLCMGYRVPAMLVGAKIGMDRSTYSNYADSRKGFYEGPISKEWNLLSSQLWGQLLPDFEGDDYKKFTCDFDTTKVKALQEDRTAKVSRSVMAFEKRVAKLDEAREEMGLKPVGGEEGDSFYEAVTLRPQQMVNAEGEVEQGVTGGQQPNQAQPQAKPKTKGVEAPMYQTKAEQDAAEAEGKKYLAFAKRRIKEGKEDEIYGYEFKYLSEAKQADLVKSVESARVIKLLERTLDAVEKG